jgi:hypothetical protein
MKDTSGVGVEMRKIYSPGCCSHHPNDVSWETCPNPNYPARKEEQDLIPLVPAAGAASGR